MSLSKTVGRLTAALSDRYVIEGELGAGGMATVYLAHDVKHERKVAVKVLRPELAAALGVERFLREIKTTANLRHPHILPLYDSGEADGLLYYVMPLVKGESLRDLLHREKQLPLDDAIRISREVADALSYAHSQDVVHRDIKPENILLEAGHAVVADFGIARAISAAGGESITQTGLTIGTPAYMSPEQAAGDQDLDGRSDLYSLACVLYEMLGGQPPFTGPTAESLVHQHIAVEPSPITNLRPGVPDEVTGALARALAKTPADRFSPTTQFADALARPAVTASASVRQRHPLRVAGLGAVAVVGLAALGLVLWQPWAREEVAAASASPAWTILADVAGSAPEETRDLVGSLLASDIDASGVALTLPQSQILRGLASAMKPDTTRLTHVVAKELAERGRIGTVFAPELEQVGGTYALTVRVLPAEGDSVLVTGRVTAADDDALIPASREVVERLMPVLSVLMGGAVRPPRRNPPVTSSLAAFRKHQEAGRLIQLGRYHEAVALSRDALAIDPDFAGAWRLMGRAYDNADFADSAAYARREALKRPERLTELTVLTLETLLSGDRVARRQLLEREYRETGNLRVGNNYAITVDRYEDAVAIMEEMAARSPFGLAEIAIWNWVNWLLALGRVAEAETRVAGLDGTPRELPMKALLALRRGDWDAAERVAMEVARDRDRSVRWTSDALWILASARAAQGRIREAVGTLHEMIGTNQRASRDFGYRVAQFNNLILTIVAGLEAKAFELERLQADTAQRARVYSGLWAAELGDTALAKSYLATLTVRELGEFDTPTAQETRVAALHARVAARRGDWEEAVRRLEPVTGDGVDRGRSELLNWLVAEAHESLGHLDTAANFYSGIAAGDWLGYDESRGFGFTYSFSHRKAALLYGRLGQDTVAIEHWLAFLDAFTAPDPEYQWMVTEARAELETLARGR